MEAEYSCENARILLSVVHDTQIRQVPVGGRENTCDHGLHIMQLPRLGTVYCGNICLRIALRRLLMVGQRRTAALYVRGFINSISLAQVGDILSNLDV